MPSGFDGSSPSRCTRKEIIMLQAFILGITLFYVAVVVVLYLGERGVLDVPYDKRLFHEKRRRP